MKNATVKWFNAQKGYGFIVDSETGENVFCHYSQLQMEGFKLLHEDDMVEYELGAGFDERHKVERQQAINVKPILTMKMIEDSLKENNLHVKNMKTALGENAYMVVDQNNVIQSSEQGMTFMDLAAFAGFEIVEKSA